MVAREANWWQGLMAATTLVGIVVTSSVLMGAEPDADAHRAIEMPVKSNAAFAKIVSLEWNDITLAEAAKQLQSLVGVTVAIDQPAMSDAGASETTKISCALRDLPLRNARNARAWALDLVCIPKDEVLLITTPERAGTEQVVRVYDVLDLVKPTKAANADQLDYDSLIDLIITTVQPTTWDEVGGPSSMAGGVGFGCLTIRQTEDVHEQIAHLLTALRQARDEGAKQNYEPIMADDPVLAKINASIEKTLSKPWKLDFDNVPLAEAVARLQAESKLNLHLDERALEDAGTSLDVPVTAQLSGISLRSALQLMLGCARFKGGDPKRCSCCDAGGG